MTSDTAVIMIDMQNSYYATDGLRARLGYPDIWRLDETVDECSQLLNAARALDMPIIYTYGGSKSGGADAIPLYRAAYANAREGFNPVPPEDEAWKKQIMDKVAPLPGDILLQKPRWCAFQYTELEGILRNLGVRRLIVAGLQTNVCVETTVRAALMRNFLVAVPEDAVSTDGEDLHRHGLQSMKILYAEVAPWRELVDPSLPWDRAISDVNYGRTELVGVGA